MGMWLSGGSGHCPRDGPASLSARPGSSPIDWARAAAPLPAIVTLEYGTCASRLAPRFRLSALERLAPRVGACETYLKLERSSLAEVDDQLVVEAAERARRAERAEAPALHPEVALEQRLGLACAGMDVGSDVGSVGRGAVRLPRSGGPVQADGVGEVAEKPRRVGRSPLRPKKIQQHFV